RWSPFIGWVAVVWMCIICVMFVLPPVSPVTVDTFNYAPVAVAVVLVFATLSWFLAGHKHFMVARVGEGHTSLPPEQILEEQILKAEPTAPGPDDEVLND